MSVTISDRSGTYDLAPVASIRKGGTPHPELKLGHAEECAVLVLHTGAEVQTLVPYSVAVRAFASIARGVAPDQLETVRESLRGHISVTEKHLEALKAQLEELGPPPAH